MDRPFIFVNMAMTVDGKITSARRQYPRFTSAADRRNMDRLRAEADAILVGAGTMRADNPKLHVRDPRMQDYRRALGRRSGLLKILVTASADLPSGERFFTDDDGGGRIVATTSNGAERARARLSADVEVWNAGGKRVDLREVLKRLVRRGVRRLLVEGGGELNWEFLREDLVDELFVTVAPALLGGRDAPTLLEGMGFSMAGQRRLRLIDLRLEQDEIFCRYAVVR